MTQPELSKAFLTPAASPAQGLLHPLPRQDVATHSHPSHAHLANFSASLSPIPPLPQVAVPLQEVFPLWQQPHPLCLLFWPWNVELRKPQALWPELGRPSQPGQSPPGHYLQTEGPLPFLLSSNPRSSRISPGPSPGGLAHYSPTSCKYYHRVHTTLLPTVVGSFS